MSILIYRNVALGGLRCGTHRLELHERRAQVFHHLPSNAWAGWDAVRVEVLPDIVPPNPVIVFCGLAGAESTKLRDHYYETPGNSFWESLHLSGLSPRRLRPEEDHVVAELGLGLTDLVGHWDPRWVEIDDLVEKLERWRPDWLAFTSKTVAHEAARALGVRRPGLGPADWHLGPAQVFVLPGVSGANQRKDYDGRPNRLSWWRDLAALA